MFKHFKEDLPASLVVFLVAIPLCLGIALASNAPLFSGIIAGIIGGIVIGSLSGSALSVSGPAAGLALIVLDALQTFNNQFEVFLLAVALGGVIQMILGFARAGSIGNYIPSSVIKGMLAAIGLILILKQVPHAFGFDFDWEGDEAFLQEDGDNTFTAIYHAIINPNWGALIIAVIAAMVIQLWNQPFFKRYTFFKLFPGALTAVVLGVLINMIYGLYIPEWALGDIHLVNLPLSAIEGNPSELITLPDFTAFGNTDVYIVAVQIALVASIETLLSLEAVDKIDPHRRLSPPNRELKAQGFGNFISGMIGGLPITAVIVRSSANVVAGGRTKLSAISHGVLLLISAMLIPHVLNLIPKAALASILILVGYKLISPSVIRENLKKGWNQFIPFAVTIVAILLTDLLKGIGIGLLFGIFFVIRTNFMQGITYVKEAGNHFIRLRDSVNYLNKGKLSKIFEEIPSDSHVLIDGTHAKFIDPDIYELINDYLKMAPEKNIAVELRKSNKSPNVYFRTEGDKFDHE